MELTNTVALITGGATGIGRATALELARRGADVAVGYNASADAAAATVVEIESLGRRAIAVQGDVAEDADCRAMVATTATVLGRLDVLVCSAGTTVMVPHADLEGVSADDFIALFRVNALGPFQVSRAAAPLLREGRGEIVFISSTAGVAGVGSSIPYCASKAALNNITLTLARALAPEVRVNAVAPGFVSGRWWNERVGEEVAKQVQQTVSDMVPLRAACSPEDVGRVVVDLINGPDLRMGEVLVLDGGMLLADPLRG